MLRSDSRPEDADEALPVPYRLRWRCALRSIYRPLSGGVACYTDGRRRSLIWSQTFGEEKLAAVADESKSQAPLAGGHQVVCELSKVDRIAREFRRTQVAFSCESAAVGLARPSVVTDACRKRSIRGDLA